MSPAGELVADLQRKGVTLWLDGPSLRFRAPKGVLDEASRNTLRALKHEVVAHLLAQPAPSAFAEVAQAARDAQAPSAGERAPAAGPALPEVLPASHAQETFVAHYHALGNLRAHHLSIAARVHGPMDLERLKSSLRQLLARQAAMRTRYVRRGAQIGVVIDQSTEPALELIDLRGQGAQASSDDAVRQLLEESRSRPFDLEAGPLVRFTLVTLASELYILFIVLHHSIADDWSLSLIRSELAAFYAALEANVPAALPPLRCQFTDHVRRVREWVSGPEGARQLAYWQAQLAGAVDPFWLPQDPSPSRDPAVLAGLNPRILPSGLTDGLRAFARHNRTTLFVVLLSAATVVLARWSGRRDNVLTIVQHERQRSDLLHLVASLINIWLLRVELTGAAAFADALLAVRSRVMENMPFQHLPYQIVRPLLAGLEQSAPLRDIWFNYAAAPTNMDIAGTAAEVPHSERVRMEWFDWGTLRPLVDSSRLGVKIFVQFMDDGTGPLRFLLRYDGSMFSDATIAAVMGNLVRLLEAIAADRNEPVGPLRLA